MSFPTKLCAVLAFGLSVCAQSAQSQTFVTAYNPTAPVRNNYSGFVGMQFTVGASPVSVISLGRIYRTGNTGTHTVKLINAQTATDVTGGSVQITMTAGTANSFEYAALAAPVQLQANTSYYLVSQETTGGDQWYDYWPVTTTNVATVNGAVYLDIHGVPQVVGNSAGASYVPLSFQYGAGSTTVLPTVTIYEPIAGAALTSGSYLEAFVTTGPGLTVASVQFRLNNQSFGAAITNPATPSAYIPISNVLSGTYSVTAEATDSAGNSGVSSPVQFSYTDTPQPLLTGQTLGPLRNNYGDPYGNFVGLEFTVGSEPLNVFELGRYVAPGNKLPHVLKLVNAATGVDVPGGSVTVNTAGATAGQYLYGYLPTEQMTQGPAAPLIYATVTLAANTSYYLLSQETMGGDQWYDLAPVTPNSFATVSGPVYQSDSGAYILVPKNASSSYVPVNLGVRTVPPPYTIGISLGTQANATYAGTITATAYALSNTTLPIVKVQFQVDGQPFGPLATYSSITSDYQAVLDTTQLSNGGHTLTVMATDSLGDTATSASQNFTVNNTSSTLPPPASAAFVTAFKPTFLRNNYSGWVGMQFTAGAANVTVASLGRICVAGNSGTHTVKLVQAPAGTDLTGGSVSVSMAGCTAGQFVYAPLAAAVKLTAGASYYLASLETSGGDQWYDYSPVTVTTAATVNGPIYFDGAHWVPVASPSSSYVPVNFLTATTSGGTSTVTVSVTQSGAVLTATASSTGGPIVSVQFKVDGFPFYSPVTSAPYTLTLPALNFGTHYATAVALDSLGNTGTSSQLLLSNSSYGGALESIINFSGTTLRNNYTGWVGFQFTTNPAPPPNSIINSATGAVGVNCISGNSQPFFVKLVLASTGADVPFSTLWLNPNSGCMQVQYGVQAVFGPMPVTLAPSTTYYLVAQETAGGDPWYNVSPAIPTPFYGGGGYTELFPTFTLDGPVYWNGFQYVLVPTPNYSFVGLQFAGFAYPI